MLLLSRADVESLLDPLELIDAVARAMADLSAGRASMPDRVAALVPEHDGLLGAMPGYVPSLGALTAKLVTLFPRNADGPLPTHQALVGVFDPATGEPIAIIDGTAITALRTAAGSALSTRLLARPDARVLAIVGTGVQARAHARSVPLVREFEELRVAGRDAAKAERLAAELRADGLPARAAASYEEAVRGADVVCATTHALEPVVRGDVARAGRARHVGRLQPAGPRARRRRRRALARRRRVARDRARAAARRLQRPRAASGPSTSTPRSASWSPARARAARRTSRSRSTSRSAWRCRTRPPRRSRSRQRARARSRPRGRDLTSAIGAPRRPLVRSCRTRLAATRQAVCRLARWSGEGARSDHVHMTNALRRLATPSPSSAPTAAPSSSASTLHRRCTTTDPG